MRWKPDITRQLTTPNESPRLVGDSLQVSIFQIHQIFNISYFPKFNLSFEKKISLSQNAQKFAQNRQTVVMVVSIEILALLET